MYGLGGLMFREKETTGMEEAVRGQWSQKEVKDRALYDRRGGGGGAGLGGKG